MFLFRIATAMLVCLTVACPAPAREREDSARAAPVSVPDVLTAEQWRQLDSATDRGLAFLATKQRRNGSFDTPEIGQPGVTSLCVLAFLSRGHVPHEGRYGQQIDRAIDYVLSTQQNN